MNSISGFCPYCHKEVTYSWAYFSESGGDIRNWFKEYFKNEIGAWALGECPSCKKCVLIEFNKNIHDDIWFNKILPFPLPSPVDKRIPQDIKKDLEEAKLCFSVGAFRACAAMCRRAIQQSCLEKGVGKNKDLDKQIDELKDKGIITEQIKEWAHTTRFVGNDAVHPETPEVTKEDADGVLSLTEQLMNILYVMSAISQEKNKVHKKPKNKK